jgi:hypothetical protein
VLDHVSSSLILSNLFLFLKGGSGRTEVSIVICSIDRIFAMFRLTFQEGGGKAPIINARSYKFTLLDPVSSSLAFSNLFS